MLQNRGYKAGFPLANIFARSEFFFCLYPISSIDGSSWETNDKWKIRFARKNSQVENRHKVCREQTYFIAMVSNMVWYGMIWYGMVKLYLDTLASINVSCFSWGASHNNYLQIKEYTH